MKSKHPLKCALCDRCEDCQYMHHVFYETIDQTNKQNENLREMVRFFAFMAGVDLEEYVVHE